MTTWIATFSPGIHVCSLRAWFHNTARPKPKHKIRVEVYGYGIRWGCSCQSYTPPGHTIACIPMTNGPVPAACPHCGAKA